MTRKPAQSNFLASPEVHPAFVASVTSPPPPLNPPLHTSCLGTYVVYRSPQEKAATGETALGPHLDAINNPMHRCLPGVGMLCLK